MTCNFVEAIPGCLTDSATGTNVPITIHYTYGYNTSGKVALASTGLTTPLGYKLGPLGPGQTVSSGCCPVQTPAVGVTKPGSTQITDGQSWDAPADAFSVTFLCLSGTAEVTTQDGSGLTMQSGETLSWSREDVIQTLGPINIVAGADSLVHITWHI